MELAPPNFVLQEHFNHSDWSRLRRDAHFFSPEFSDINRASDLTPI